MSNSNLIGILRLVLVRPDAILRLILTSMIIRHDPVF